MKPTLTSIAAAIVVGCATLTAPVFAQEAKIFSIALQENDSASERIDYSGKLRMLSQRIPSAACHLAAEIAPEESRKLLTAATAEFTKILDALEMGDADLEINSPEPRRKTIVRIQDLRAVWEPLKVAAEAMAAGEITDTHLSVILDENMNVLDSAKLLVSEIVGAYSNPIVLVQADSFLIDIAGRQRMLTQKMSKESCMIATSYASAGAADALKGTMQMFDTSLEALRHGMPAAGIRRPPTAGIAAGLEEVLANWVDVKPTLEAVLAGSKLDASTETRKFQGLNTTMATMNKVVGMYSAATKKEL